MNHHPIAFFFCSNNTMYHAKQLTCLLSSKFDSRSHVGFLFLCENNKKSIRDSLALFSARSLPKHSWVITNNVFLGRD